MLFYYFQTRNPFRSKPASKGRNYGTASSIFGSGPPASKPGNAASLFGAAPPQQAPVSTPMMNGVPPFGVQSSAPSTPFVPGPASNDIDQAFQPLDPNEPATDYYKHPVTREPRQDRIAEQAAVGKCK